MREAAPDWREGHRLLSGRLAAAPERVRAVLAGPAPAPGFSLAGLRSLRTTGLGSSAAHAQLLAHLLAEELGLPARFVETGALLDGPPPDAGDQALVVFSQGLSPHARFALARPEAWRGLCVVTAVEPGEPGEACAALRAAQARGARVVGLGCDTERGTLVRVLGPLVGTAQAYRLAAGFAEALGRAPGTRLAPDPERVARALARAAAAGDAPAPELWERPLVLLAAGATAGLVDNLRLKLVEGFLRPAPAVCELLAFAHGPLQQLQLGPATLLALASADAGREQELLARIGATLDPERHALLRLPAELPGPLALFEHEARLDAWLLAWIAQTGSDAVRFPGRGADAPLYGLAPPSVSARVEMLSSPEVSARLRRGARTAVVPLGATEQHGAHLPLATDTWIADAVADRLCARLPDALRLPTLPVGCSEEHMGFSGTLSLAPETLAAVLGDLLDSLARHGFTRALLFSAHGGNCAPLAAALPALTRRSSLSVCAFTDLEALTRRLHQVAREAGVEPEAAGHHAGELETSILAALHPDSVRGAECVPGHAHPGPDAQALFAPRLDAHVASGVVGDPCRASAERAERYLGAWADLLAEHFGSDARLGGAPPSGS